MLLENHDRGSRATTASRPRSSATRRGPGAQDALPSAAIAAMSTTTGTGTWWGVRTASPSRASPRGQPPALTIFALSTLLLPLDKCGT